MALLMTNTDPARPGKQQGPRPARGVHHTARDLTASHRVIQWFALTNHYRGHLNIRAVYQSNHEHRSAIVICMCALVMSMTVLAEKRFVYYRRQDGVPVDVALNEDISDRMLLSVLIPGFLLRNETGS